MLGERTQKLLNCLFIEIMKINYGQNIVAVCISSCFRNKLDYRIFTWLEVFYVVIEQVEIVITAYVTFSVLSCQFLNDAIMDNSYKKYREKACNNERDVIDWPQQQS